MERWEGWLRPLAISVCYVLCFHGEIPVGEAFNSLQFSFLSGQFVITSQSLGVSMLLRPLVFMKPAYCLPMQTILRVWRDVRSNGWQNRWRFRHDWPMLPRVNRPIFFLTNSATKADVRV